MRSKVDIHHVYVDSYGCSEILKSKKSLYSLYVSYRHIYSYYIYEEIQSES